MDLDERSILLTDRVAVVTGAARGIGAATVSLLARCGATVVACDRDPAVEECGAAVRRALDVRDTAAVDHLLDDVRDRFGRVDVLVNNAGGSFVASFLDVSAKGEAMLVAENFTQVTHAVRASVPLMSPGAAIVNVTSVEAHQAAPGFAVYSAMKAALANLTRTLALELAPRGIRVNAVAPDALPTGGETDARDALLASDLPYSPAHLPPLGHFGAPEDAAAAILFLASDLARFVTGTTVHVDGGTWAAGGWRRLADDG